MITETLKIIVDADVSAAEGQINGLKTLTNSLSLFGTLNFLKKAVDLWETQSESVSKLDTAVNNHRQNMEGHNTKDLEAISAHTQSITTYGDEAINVGNANLLTFGMTYEQIKKMQGPMADMVFQTKGASAGGQQFLDISNQIEKAWMNGASVLKRNGTLQDADIKRIDAIKDKNERLNELIKVMSTNYGKQAENFAKTDAGKRLKDVNSIGDQLEHIGEAVLPVINEGVAFLSKHIGYVLPIVEAAAALKISSTFLSGMKMLVNTSENWALNMERGAIAAAGAEGAGLLPGQLTAGMGGRLGAAAKSSNRARMMGKVGGAALAGAGVFAAHEAGGWMGLAGGAMSGAAMGAELGTIFPGIGNIAGAIGGGLLGAAAGGWKLMFDGKESQANLGSRSNSTGGNHLAAN